MKKQTKQKLLIGTIASVTAILGIVGGATLSKYFTKIEGNGSAVVARWSFKANNSSERFTNIPLTTNYNNKVATNTIAPGTKGSFDIVLDATNADVGIDYVIKLSNFTNKPNNLYFKYDGNKINNLDRAVEGTILLNDARTKTITIDWEWDYETGTSADEIKTNDDVDTADAGKNCTFDITVTGTQVNPNV